MYVLIINREI